MTQINTRNIEPAVDATDILKTRLQQIGRDLTHQFYVMLRTARIYEQQNDNYIMQLRRFYEFLQVAIESAGVAAISSTEGYLFFNDLRLRMSIDGYLATKAVQEAFERLSIAGLRFNANSTPEELSRAFHIIANIPPSEEDDNSEILQRDLNEAGVECLDILPYTSISTSGSKPKTIRQKKRLAKQNFFSAINAISEIVGKSSLTEQISVARVKRVVHSLVDQILNDETYLLELTALKEFDDYTFVHSVNVSIFAISMGMRLGFTRPMLAEIGFAALFHDIGKIMIPKDLLNKPSALDKVDWEQMREHPVHGVRLLGDSLTMDNHTARAMIVAFEHHKNLDGSGYPYINRTEEINLYSRIVGICDCFDALTSKRKYQHEKVGLDSAVREIQKLAGSKFDPLLTKVFTNIVGVYPAGTVLLLDTGELAYVLSSEPEDIFRPRIKIIASTSGVYAKPVVAELTEKSANSDTYLRNVVRVVDPEKYNIDISPYILAEE